MKGNERRGECVFIKKRRCGYGVKYLDRTLLKAADVWFCTDRFLTFFVCFVVLMTGRLLFFTIMF